MNLSEALMVAEGYAKRMKSPKGHTARESEVVAVVLAKAVRDRDKIIKDLYKLPGVWDLLYPFAKKAISEGRGE